MGTWRRGGPRTADPTKKTRALTHLSDHGVLQSFDISPDGKSIVFGRSRDNSDIVLIDLPASKVKR